MKFERIAFGLLLPIFGLAADSSESNIDENEGSVPSLVNLENVLVSTVFPDSDGNDASVLTNGVETPVEFHVENKEPQTVTIGAMGGGFYEKPKKKETQGKLYANLTTTQIGPFTVKSGEKFNIKHKISVTLPPTDFDLNVVLLGDYEKQIASIDAGKVAVTVEDQPISALDPKLILVQAIIALTTIGLGYFLSTTFLMPYLEPKKKAKETKKDDTRPAGVQPNEKGYDESWIPETHLKKTSAGKKKK